MAKKGGKKKGKGGGKGGKKSGKREDEMTLKEAIMAFQIQVKEKSSEELQFEIKGLQEKNKRYQERNTRLKDEQFIHIKTLLRQAKEQEQELEQKEVYNSEHVEQALKEKWTAGRHEEQRLDELRLKIAATDEQYDKLRNEVEFWKSYSASGSAEHKTQIHLLEGELEDMQQNFDDMCAHLKRQLDAAKLEVKTHTDRCMAEQKHLASEKAMGHLDPVSVQEVHENEWLKNEAEVHRAEGKLLRVKLQELEKENLEIIGELLDCRQEDLKISRNFYMTQFREDDQLTDDKLSDMDMKQMSIYRGAASPESSQMRAIEDRPRSAMQSAVEDRVFSIMEAHNEEDEDYEEDEDGGEDEIDIQKDMEYLHLGPLEIKLLCVVGEQKPIHPLDARLQIVDGSKPDVTVTRPKWPVEPPMMRAALECSPSDVKLPSSGGTPGSSDVMVA